MALPQDFIQLLLSEHGDLAPTIVEGLESSKPITSIRYNSKKYKGALPHPVPWCSHGTFLAERPSFTFDPIFHAGGYYVQEASSMLLWHALNAIEVSEQPMVLDLCAAPGGKSTLILDWLAGRGILVANETIKSRAQILKENIIKWGYDNAVVTNNDAAHFQSLPLTFDVIVVDAPCSGEGMFRKDMDAIGEWSAQHVHHCSVRQQRIIADIVPSLADGGYLIYSTCTFNHSENIDNVIAFSRNYNLACVSMNVAEDWRIVTIEKSGAIGYQCFPGIAQGEGFFIAILKKNRSSQKPDEKTHKTTKSTPKPTPWKTSLQKWIHDVEQPYLITKDGDIYMYPELLHRYMPTFLTHLNVKYSGTLVGQWQKNLFLPDHALALSDKLHQDIPTIELSLDMAIDFLSRSLNAIDSPHKSWIMATYQGLALGWLKNLGNRINNYYPVEWRIRNKR